MNRQLAPLLLCSSILLAACGGGGSSTPPPPPPAISVSFSTAPPSAMNASATAQISVTVSNDSSNSGVTFSCAPTGSCGTFTTVTSTAATYNAPATPPTGGGATITATSVKDTSKSATANVTINTTGPAITVSLSSPPPATLSTGSPNNTAIIAATTNDTAGVNWSCTPANTCGSFSPTSTLTTVTTTYTSPSAVPSGGSVTIVATSKTDSTKSAKATVNITGSASLASLKGQYAFLVHASVGNRGIATWIGSVTLDGAGNVTGGVEEIASKIYMGDVADPILPTGATNSLSGYSVDPSGHGRLIMSTPMAEELRMSFVLTSPTHAEVIEADGPPGQGNPGSGTLDLQTAPAGGFAASQISGTYSFTMVGVDDATSSPLSFGGSFSSDGSSHITSGSIDINSGASQVETDSIGSSTFDGPPDTTTGRGKFHFAVQNPAQSRTFVYYIISPKVLRLIEADGVADMGGSAYLQPASPPPLSGNFVYQHSGWTSTTSRTVAAGQFTLTSGSISGGVCDSNPGGGVAPTTAGSVSGSYAAPILTLTESAKTSTLKLYPVDSTINILDPNSTSGLGGSLFLHTDSSINGTGILLPEQMPQPISTNYALNLTNTLASTPTELDLVGILAGGTTGLADYDQVDTISSNPMIGATLSTTLTADPGHAGRYTGNITVTPPSAAVSAYSFIPGVAPPTTFSFSLYQANATQALGVEIDNKANVVGQMIQQNLP